MQNDSVCALDEEEKRRAAAALPPMMLSARDRRGVFYIDLNGVVRNPLEEHNNFVENFLSTWSEDEKLVRTLLNTMFKEQIVAYGKNFAAIAEFLDRKTVKDCVLYYYLSKKRQNYKALMGKRRRKPAKYYKPPVMPKAEEVLMRAPQDAGAVPLNGPKEYECCVCNCKIDNETNPGRVLTRASYEAHGVDANQANPSDVRICQKCRMKAMKAKNATRCQVGTCHNARRKVKPTRPMPPKWKLMNVEQKEFFMHHMLIPDGIMKCCPACHKKITKKLDMLFNGELEAEMKLWQESATVIWTEEEIEVLRLTVEAVGIDDWETVAEKMDADNHKFSAEQCRQQFEKLGAADKAKQSNMESEEEEGSDEENEAQQTAPLTTLKEEHPEAEHDPSGESSATLSADEVANHDECTVLSPAVSTQQSSATQIYKPRFRGVAHSASESASFDVPDSTDISSIIKREVERASETSPAVHMQAHDVLVRSSSSDTAPKSSSTSALPTAICKPSAFTSAATVPSPHSTTQGLGGLPQCAFTMPSAMRQAAAPSLSVSSNQSISTVSSTRGSITQGTPMMRPPSVPGYEPLLDKLKQQTQVLSAGAAAAASVTPGSAVGASTTPLGQAATAATPLGIQVAAVAPFATGAQPPPVGTPFAAPGTPAPPDSRMSPIAAFYSQFATLDPALQYAMTLKLMQAQQQQQEFERARLAVFQSRGIGPGGATGASLMDAYRQQALAMGLSEQQAQSCQQHLSALTGDPKFLLWQQLLQQQQAAALKQQQQAAAASSSGLAQAATASMLSNVQATAAAGHLPGQQSVEQQHQTALAQLVSMSSAVAAAAADPQQQQQQQRQLSAASAALSAANSQLFNDFRNAEQMRKERDEGVKQLEAQQRQEEARLVEELNHATRLEYPRAVMYQNTELAQAQLQKIEQLKERHSALQHYKRALDEKLLDEKLQKTAGLQAAAAGASGVIVRGATEERATALGVVSKGAMKEFPPSMAKSAIGIAGPPSSFSAHGLIGISRSPNESTMAARRLVAHGQATSQQQQLQQQESVSHANAAEVGAARSHARADSMINAGIVRKTCDPLMFDLNQSAQSLFRAHYHNVIDDELSGNDAPSSAEVKRKSGNKSLFMIGIHTVYLPSVPGGHHTPSMKMSSSATAGHRRTTTSPALSMQRAGALPSTHAAAPSPLGVTTPQQQQTASASARSSPSAAQFAHVLPASMQHPQPQSHHSPSHPSIASTIPLQPASLSMRAGTGSPAGVAFPSRTPAATPSLMSPRTPLTINPGLASPISSTHPSPQTPATAPPAAFRASTPSSSPFQMSPSLGSLSPNVGASPRGSLSNLTFHAAAFTHPAGISTVSSSVLASNTQPTTAPSEAPNKSQLPSVKPSEPSAEEPSSASAETRPEPFMVSANFEPLSPDNGDSPPMSDFNSTSQSGDTSAAVNKLTVICMIQSFKVKEPYKRIIAGTPDQSCMPLFSLLNLPENGSVNSTPVRPVLSTADLHDSMNDEQDTVTSSIVTTVTSARPPPPTYEPLSDDE
ncbi:unnamed protein product [Toxocara canis]|uniref:SANT domain-containing protein n=1 Tax=Toxocara canis TaxID=6265 RepID=A0A183UR57_TOXCA|nr:unnamed protein product [Toxocara canis]